MNKTNFCLFSCESDSGANVPGSAYGPKKLKNLFINENNQFIDYKSKETNKILNIKEIVNKCSVDYLKKLKEEKYFPILLGGDHSLSMGSISACSKYCQEKGIPLYIFWFDAHTDINLYESSETKNIHGMPLAMLSNLDKSGLILDNQKYIDLNNLYIFGARSIDNQEKINLKENNIFYSNNYYDCLNKIKNLLKILPKNSFFHISFDIDCLDPNVASGVSTPEKNGFNTKELINLINPIFNDNRFKSLDIVEYNPIYDKNNQTLNNIKKIVELL